MTLEKMAEVGDILAFFKIVKVSESESPSVLSDSLRPHGLYSPWNSPGQTAGMSSLSLLQGNLNPGIEPRSPTLQADSLPAEPQGSPRILERVAYPFSSRSSRPRNHWGLLHCRWILYQLSYQGSPVYCKANLKLKCKVIRG